MAEMICHIIKNKQTGEEYLIPGCSSVLNNWGDESLTNRQIIKNYCTCIRTKREKYETKSRDEVFIIIDDLKKRISYLENHLEKLKEDLGGLESEVFMLGMIEIFDFEKEDKKYKNENKTIT